MSAYLTYDWSTATDAPPTSNQVRLDAAAPYHVANHLMVRYLTSDGVDATAILMAIDLQSDITIQDKNDHTLYVTVRTTGYPTDAGTYVDLPVVFMSGAGTLLNNQAIVLAFIAPAVTVRLQALETETEDLDLRVDALEAEASLPGPPPLAPPPALVSIVRACAHLQLPIALDTDPRDPLQDELEFKLLTATAIVLNYLKVVPPEWVDPDTTPCDVQAAILIQLGELWRFRGDDLEGQGSKQTDGYLSMVITNLLRRWRDPAYV